MLIKPQHLKFVQEFEAKYKPIKYYIRKKSRLLGVLAGYKDETGNIRVGWSKCYIKLDNFDKKFGSYIAYNRALKGHHFDQFDSKVPNLIRKNLPEFLVRLSKYYKKETQTQRV